MTGLPPDHPWYLGPTTEARFAEEFAHKAVIACAQAAALIGVDPKTLPSLPIRSVPKGAHRGYTERDLRAYLLEGPAECAPVLASPSPKPKARAVAPRPNVRVVNFSERAGQRR